MTSHLNVDLLKQYIKTLIMTQVVFPGICPRPWGQEFTPIELATIYRTLSRVINTANAATHQRLMDEFVQVEPSHMHWFLGDYWSELVPLIDAYSAELG